MVIGTNVQRQPTDEELDGLAPEDRAQTLASWDRTQWWQREGMGYNVLQASRPQTLAYALHDSPVGQLAWIVEKFFEWTDSADRPEDAVDRDLMLTNVMLYWLTGTAGSSARLYYERAHSDRPGAPPHGSGVPTAVADFPAEIYVPLRRLAEQRENVVRWTRFEHGGHFAALEQPGPLVEDIRAFFRGLRRDG
jgi:pimeloyl-ACP methyl ester carboxylesterase